MALTLTEDVVRSRVNLTHDNLGKTTGFNYLWIVAFRVIRMMSWDVSLLLSRVSKDMHGCW